MQKILIDGSFVDKKVTGVQRFCWEVFSELYKQAKDYIAIAIPKSVDVNLLKDYDCEIIQYGNKNNKIWQFFTLGKIAKRYKYNLLCMSNLDPLFKKDYLVLHDVTFLEKEGNNNKLWALKYKIFVSLNIYKHKKIFTVSNFSKSRILNYYPKLKEEDVIVCGNGYSQLSNEQSTLKYKDFFLSVGSSSNNKNFKYILELAKANPNSQFIITGKIYGDFFEQANKIKNLKMLGYVSNTDLKYLYKNCNAFILPSTYEGYGLPPLEAVSCGCKKLFLSNIPPFKEIYGDVATFFEPLEYDKLVNLESGFKISEENAKILLSKNNWTRTAKIILEGVDLK